MPGPWRVVLVPAVVTLAVTLLRLFAELQGWSAALANNEGGAPGALLGIAWLHRRRLNRRARRPGASDGAPRETRTGIAEGAVSSRNNSTRAFYGAGVALWQLEHDAVSGPEDRLREQAEGA